MATSDLLNELQKESLRRDAEGERRICQARGRGRGCTRHLFAHATRAAPLAQVVLKQLEDQSADVQNLAVKWCAAASCCAPGWLLCCCMRACAPFC